ncbi:helix-turn-helix transcriptional regulator [Kibdelosporangium philippinense]
MPKASARLLSLLTLLQAAATGQERLEVSQRTVRRDVDRLRELGYPIVITKGPGGYRLEAGKDLPPLLFDDDQAIAIAVALQTATSEAAARALTAIRQVMPARLRHRVDALRITTVDTHMEVDGSVLMAPSAAIHAHEVLRFDHTSTLRRVEPHHLVTKGGRWYLVAWDLDRETGAPSARTKSARAPHRPSLHPARPTRRKRRRVHDEHLQRQRPMAGLATAR